jgi:hypothetical protein
MRRFDPEIYETNQNKFNSVPVESSVRRDPYFEKYTYQVFREISENPAEVFNFFLENNDILRKITTEDETKLLEYSQQRKDKCTLAALATGVGVYVYDKVLMPMVFKERQFRFKNFRFLAFMVKYGFWPLVGFRLMDNYLDVDEHFKQAAIKYNFGYEEFSQAMGIFERAKLAGLLDELLVERSNFDFKKLENVPFMEQAPLQNTAVNTPRPRV